MIPFFPEPRREAQGLCIFFFKASLMGVGELAGGRRGWGWGLPQEHDQKRGN